MGIKFYRNEKLLQNTSLINYIPIKYEIEYTINSISNIITVKKENFKILNSVLITFELNSLNKDMDIFVNIYEDNNIFKNKLIIYKENNKCYSYILIDSPDKVLSFDIHIDNYKNVKEIKLKNIDYIYYYNNITNKFFLYNFPYKDNNLKLENKQINNFKFLSLKYDKYYLNSGIRPVKKLNKDIINIPNLELNILNKNPLVSIIITCYNAENTIEMSINSILNQTYKNIELIIVDDCSSDKSRNIINRFKNKDNIKIIFNEKNNKTYYSRNIALQYCSGDFITFQDADDISLYDRIEKQVTYSVNNKSHINIGLCLRSNILDQLNINETKCNMFDKIINNLDKTKFKYYFKNKFILPLSKIPHLALVTSFIHKSVFNDIGNFAILPCSGDIELIERFLCKKYNLIFHESEFGNLSTLLSNVNNIGSIHIMKETIYLAGISNTNLTSKYDKKFRSELKQKYRKEYEKNSDNNERIHLMEKYLLSKNKNQLETINTNIVIKFRTLDDVVNANFYILFNYPTIGAEFIINSIELQEEQSDRQTEQQTEFVNINKLSNWVKNQDVDISFNDNSLIVVSNKNCSTPGIKFDKIIYLKPHTTYEFKINGSKKSNSYNVLPYIINNNNIKHITLSKNLLS